MVPPPRLLPAAFCRFNWEWYMSEDQVAGKRKGGVRGEKATTSSQVLGLRPQEAHQCKPDHSWGQTGENIHSHLTLKWEQKRQYAFFLDDWYDGKMWWISKVLSNRWIRLCENKRKPFQTLFITLVPLKSFFYRKRSNKCKRIGWALDNGTSNNVTENIYHFCKNATFPLCGELALLRALL